MCQLAGESQGAFDSASGMAESGIGSSIYEGGVEDRGQFLSARVLPLVDGGRGGPAGFLNLLMWCTSTLELGAKVIEQ